MGLPAGYVESDCSEMGEVVCCESCGERCDLDTWCVARESPPVNRRYRVTYFCSEACAIADNERGGLPKQRGEAVDLWRRSVD